MQPVFLPQGAADINLLDKRLAKDGSCQMQLQQQYPQYNATGIKLIIRTC